jgi:8-oxo-dGTP pyrophosphatase MutT (NUDIX family)
MARASVRQLHGTRCRAVSDPGSRPEPSRPPSAAAEIPPELIQSAVLAPIFMLEGEPQLVLTRRRADLRRHAGEISFPGGRQDPEDADLMTTALREAEEEIGLVRDRVQVLGELPEVSTFATGYVIHPFVGVIPQGLAWTLSAREVDVVLELALRDVRDGRTRTKMTRRGFTFETDAYVVGEHLIWGATARIIQYLLETLETAGGEVRLRADG